MGCKILQSPGASAWELADRQHGVVSRCQLLALGYSSRSIQHRIDKGRLHRVHYGIYAVGRPQVTQRGRWMAAVLACGAEAVLSHEDAAALLGLRPLKGGPIHISVPARVAVRRPGVRLHRRASLAPDDVTRHHGIPVTTPVCTLIDVATRLGPGHLEAAINSADKLNLIHPEQLRLALDETSPRPGVGLLRKLLDRRTFVITDSGLERHFLPLARRAGLPLPQTGRYLSGFKVDFYWPDLGLVVEADSLRYHRTPAEQARDRIRDQAHATAGLTTLRFTDDQIAHEPGYVRATLAAVARRLRKKAA